MPASRHIPDIVERIKAAKGPREWRRYPARKGIRRPRAKPAPLTASLEQLQGASPRVEFHLVNRTTEMVRFVVLGTEPEVTIELDGNHAHRASLPASAGGTIEVRRDGRDGEVMATLTLLDTQESFS